MTDEKKIFRATVFNGTAERFIRFVCFEAVQLGYGCVTRVVVSHSLWQQVAFETNYASVPGSRMRDEIELRVSTGWVVVEAEGGFGPDRGRAETKVTSIDLDFANVYCP